jgi:hypothetical protein
MQPLSQRHLFGKAAPLLAVAALGLAAHPAAAQTTITNTLNGTFFFDPAANITSIALARTYIAGNSPTGTFSATQSVLTSSGYHGGDTSSAQSFLSTDGSSYQGTTTNLEDGIFDFKGYLNVTNPGTYNFGTYSDDGSALFIDGNEIVNNDGVGAPHYSQGNDNNMSVGLHPIELVYYNHVFNGGQGGATLGANLSGLNITNTNGTASAAPEPSAIAVWAFVGLGAAGLALKARRRKAVTA